MPYVGWCAQRASDASHSTKLLQAGASLLCLYVLVVRLGPKLTDHCCYSARQNFLQVLEQLDTIALEVEKAAADER